MSLLAKVIKYPSLCTKMTQKKKNLSESYCNSIKIQEVLVQVDQINIPKSLSHTFILYQIVKRKKKKIQKHP